MPIVKKEADRDAVSAAVAGLEGALRAAGVRVAVDAGTEKTPGWKFNFWEMKVRTERRPQSPQSSCSVQLLRMTLIAALACDFRSWITVRGRSTAVETAVKSCASIMRPKIVV